MSNQSVINSNSAPVGPLTSFQEAILVVRLNSSQFACTLQIGRISHSHFFALHLEE